MNKRMIAGLICLLLMLQPLAGCGRDPAPSDPSSGSPASGGGSGPGSLPGDPTVSDAPSGAASADGTSASSGGTNASGAKTTAGRTDSTKGTTAPAKSLPAAVATWFEGPLTDIFPATQKSDKSLAEGHIDMLKNETESIQLAVRAGSEELTGLRVSVAPFAEKGAPTISVAPIRLLNTSKASRGFTAAGGNVAKYKRGDTPGDFPEYYDVNNSTVGRESGVTYAVPAGESAGVVIEATSTAATRAGTYRTAVTLSGDQGTRRIEVSVRVWDAALPEPKNSAFSYTNWFSSAEMNGSGFPQFMDAYYDAGSFGENFFRVMANWAKVMKKQRQNVIYVPTMALLSSDMTIAADGSYRFTFRNFDRYVETFIKNGSVKSLEGGFFYEKDWYVDPPTEPNTWPTGSLVTAIFVKNGSGCTTKWVKADTAEAKAHFDRLIPALYAHLKSKGWEKMWLQHVCDEPLSALQTKQISAMYKRILSEMPGVRTLDAGSHQLTNFRDKELSINCPQLDDYERERSGYNKLAADDNGLELWSYTCVNPQGNYMTRIGDYPLLSARIIGWYDWQQGVTGYLHWGWNLWQQAKYSRNDPFSDIFCDDAVADAFLVYPDAKNMSVFEGPRSTSVRDSWEDYELLCLAAKKNAAKTRQIVNGLVRSGDNFVRDQTKLTDARLQLIRIAAG